MLPLTDSMRIISLMDRGIAVCGYIGGEINHFVTSHPRFGIAGALRGPISESPIRLGGDAYHIAYALNQLNAPTYAVGVIGKDTLGTKVYAHIKELGIDHRYMNQKEGTVTPQLLYLTDANGIINCYIYDTISFTQRDSLFSCLNNDHIGCVIVSSLKPSMKEAVFFALEQCDVPVVWYVQGSVFDMNPDQLLRYTHRAQYLVMGTHEQSYFCDTLGLTSIESLLREGPEAIIVVEYESPQGSYTYNVFASKPLSDHNFGSLTGYDSHQYRNIMLGFVAGFTYAVHRQEGLERMLRAGIVCSEQYLIHLKDQNHRLDYDTIVKAINIS